MMGRSAQRSQQGQCPSENGNADENRVRQNLGLLRRRAATRSSFVWMIARSGNRTYGQERGGGTYGQEPWERPPAHRAGDRRTRRRRTPAGDSRTRIGYGTRSLPCSDHTRELFRPY